MDMWLSIPFSFATTRFLHHMSQSNSIFCRVVAFGGSAGERDTECSQPMSPELPLAAGTTYSTLYMQIHTLLSHTHTLTKLTHTHTHKRKPQKSYTIHTCNRKPIGSRKEFSDEIPRKHKATSTKWVCVSQCQRRGRGRGRGRGEGVTVGSGSQRGRANWTRLGLSHSVTD